MRVIDNKIGNMYIYQNAKGKILIGKIPHLPNVRFNNPNIQKSIRKHQVILQIRLQMGHIPVYYYLIFL